MNGLRNQVVDVLTAAAQTDIYGNEEGERNWAGATRVTYRRCSVQPQPGAEVTDGREGITWLYLLIGPPDMALDATNRVECDGVVYEVQGPPQVFKGFPMGHVQALLRRTEG